MRKEAIYLVEYAGIPYGIAVLDRLVKRTAVEVVYARPVCVGKYLIVLGGNVDDVRESQAEVESLGPAKRISDYLLTSAHQEILAYFRRAAKETDKLHTPEAVGILETRNASSGFHSLDRALKNGSVRLAKIWLGHYIGGKLCYVLTGRVGDVQAAIDAGRAGIDEKSLLDSQVIPHPDPVTMKLLVEHYNA